MTKITLKAQRFNKQLFNETVNTKFTQLNNVADPSFFDRDLAVLDDFWYLYDKFFFIIPKLGLVESHEYLAKSSGEYAGYNQISEEIQALLDEIASLREENLQLIQESTNLEGTTTPESAADRLKRINAIKYGNNNTVEADVSAQTRT
tara:strand:- start:861 stop:1304 length:444 start_codon:yes stop_codon:yes gene_type:complete